MTDDDITGSWAFRGFYLRGASDLTGLGVEGGTPAWRSGINTSVCGDGGHPDEPAPGRYCGCGFTVARTMAPIAAYFAGTLAGHDEMWRLHAEHFGPGLAELQREHIARTGRPVLCKVLAGGKVEEIATEDERDLFLRVQHGQIEKIMLPASLAGYADALARRYDAEVEVSELDGRPWFDSFADGVAPTPEELGCALCPQPNPGRSEFPICGFCRGRIERGYLNQVNAHLQGGALPQLTWTGWQ